MGHRYLVHYLVGAFLLFIFSFFYSLFFARTKSTKTQMSEWVTFFPLDVFKHIFYFCSLISVFVLLFGCVFVLLVLLVRSKSFCKKIKNKKFKTALITSFILLLNFQSSQSFLIITILFNHHSLFQSLQFFSIITIFFNH